MNCPACANELSKRTVANVELDVCDGGCGGIWFDQYEFKKFDEASEPNPESVLKLSITRRAPSQDRLTCPRCVPKMPMMRHFASVKRSVTMDECPKCAGVWLDSGEITAIRNEFTSEDDRRRAAENLFDDLFSSTLSEEKRKSREHLERAQRFAVFTRFLK